MQDPWVETLGLDNLQISELNLPSDSRLHMGPEWIVRVDRRDDPYNAVSGSLFTSQVRWNHGPIAAPASVRAESRWMWLQPAGPVRLALIGRAGVGWARGESTLPLDDRFYLGGSSLRGFNLNSVGPANLVPRSDVDFSPAVEPIVEGMTLRSDATVGSHWRGFFVGLTARTAGSTQCFGSGGWDTTSLVAFLIGDTLDLSIRMYKPHPGDGTRPLGSWFGGVGGQMVDAHWPRHPGTGNEPEPDG